MTCTFNTQTATPSRRDFLRLLFDALYPIPNPFSSDEERARYYHEDLVQMTSEELALERRRVEWRLVFEDAPPRWLLERLDAIDTRLRDAD